MTTLILVRHAQSSNRALRSKIWQEVDHDRERFDVEVARRLEPDPGLSELGVDQAKLFSQGFAPVLRKFDRESLIVTSPMRCAIATAMPLVLRSFVSPERFLCHAELFEIGSNIYRDERPSELAARFEAEFIVTCCEFPSDADCPVQPDAESEEQACGRVDRVCAWIEALVERGDYPVIIMVLPNQLLSRCLRRWMRISPDHELTFAHEDTGVTMLEWNDEGLVVASVNEQSHLLLESDGGGNGSRDDLLRFIFGRGS